MLFIKVVALIVVGSLFVSFLITVSLAAAANVWRMLTGEEGPFEWMDDHWQKILLVLWVALLLLIGVQSVRTWLRDPEQLEREMKPIFGQRVSICECQLNVQWVVRTRRMLRDPCNRGTPT